MGNLVLGIPFMIIRIKLSFCKFPKVFEIKEKDLLMDFILIFLYIKTKMISTNGCKIDK